MTAAAREQGGTLLSGVLYSEGHFNWCFWAAIACLLVVVLATLPMRDGGVLRCAPPPPH
jgi:hypothetical protein